MGKKRKRKQFLAGFLAGVMILCSVSTLSAIAKEEQQKTDEPYPYTIFAASKKEGAFTIEANNFCVNGNVATNGTLSATGNVSINGEKLENADTEMIYIFDAIDDAYFSGAGHEEYEEDYSIAEQNINISTPVEVKGELSLTGNINLTTAIKTFEDIILNGEVKNTEDSILFSKYGDIIIESTNVNLNGLVYAPFGCVSITAQNLTLNNIIIIAQEVKITCGSVNANYNSRMAQFVGNESEELHIPEEEEKYLDGKDIHGTNNPDVSDTEEDSSEEDGSEENSSEESDSEEEDDENYGDEDAFWDLFSRYDEWEDMEDTDGDGLPDEVEKVIGSRIDMTDTDEDGLNDYYELMILGTSPTEKDTDGNGINDPDEDFDEDGLSNYEEYLLDTYPWEPDTDEDNLSDWDEVHVYGTDPHVQDCDEDGLFDGDEVALGTEPLNPDSDGDGILDGDETYEQTYVYEVEDADECAVSQVVIEMEATGNLASTTTVESIMGIDVVCSEVVGLVGEPFEIETTSEFETAKLTFVVDPSKLGDTDLSDLLFLWYDEENGQFIELETTCDEETGAVSTETTHFSSYLLVNSAEWFEAWAKELDYGLMDDGKPESTTYYTYVAIDCASMTNKEKDYYLNKEMTKDELQQAIEEDPPYDPMAIMLCETFINNLAEGEKMEIDYFYPDAIGESLMQSDKNILQDFLAYLDGFYAMAIDNDTTRDGYSNYEQALMYMFEHKLRLENLDGDKRIIFISSGKSKYDISLDSVYYARKNNIPIYTIAVGVDADVKNLRAMAHYTGGKFYAVSDPEDIDQICQDINLYSYMDPTLDSDEDGIPDIMEIRGMRNQWGEIVHTDPTLDDSDYDGLKDGEEVDIQVRIKTDARKKEALQDGDPYYYMYSHPKRPDTDGDGYMDEDEIRVYGSNPWKPDVEIYQLSQDYIQVFYTGNNKWRHFRNSIVSYGGAQRWFHNLEGKHNKTIAELGCGLISGADILLYLSKSNSKYDTEETDKVTYIGGGGYIEYESYMKYLSDMEWDYFYINNHIGILGTAIATNINLYSVVYHLDLDAYWCMSKSFVLPRIKEMLRNDIPVTLSIGPDKKHKVNLYVPGEDKYSFIPPREYATEVGDHYVTVTGLIIDDIKNETWLEVSSWGRHYYINYEEYMYFVDNYSNSVFSNIVYIYKTN